MAKATKQVKPLSATRKPTRRKRPQRAAPLHPRAAAVKKAPTNAAPLAAAQPTEKGRKLLRCLSRIRRAWRASPDDGDITYIWKVLDKRARKVAGEIAAAPVRSMSNVVDRAIAMAWASRPPGDGDEWDKEQVERYNALLAPLLAIGGVTLDECDEDVSRSAA